MNNNPTGLSVEQEARIEKVYNDLYQFKKPLPKLSYQTTINRVLVLPDPVTAVTKSGIVVPDTAKERPELGTVLAVGPGRYTDSGAMIPCLVEPGDRVQYGKWSGSWVFDDELNLMVILMLDADCIVRRPQPFLLEQTGTEAEATN
jgi:chaperonin GroES